MSDFAIRMERLSKKYEIMLGKHRHDTLRDQISESFGSLFHRNGRSHGNRETFWALKDLSLEVKPGEVIGVIGRNGAGKSTLLKILSRITAPTFGSAEIRGRVGSLLEVGTGFHPELTGRENIYLNGAILGMKKTEIERKFDEIVAFSEIDKFIDTPVKRYSSGMFVRLAFAVAAHLEPEVLIVDEVLAVGDIAFQRKCLGKMEGVAKQGRTVLFVSHNMAAVENLCQQVIVLDKGHLVFKGTVKKAIDYYMHNLSGEGDPCGSHTIDLARAAGRPADCRPLLKRLTLFTDGDTPLNGSLKVGAPFKARVDFCLEDPSSRFYVCLGFDNLLGQRIFTANSLFQPNCLKGKRSGTQSIVCEIPSLPFLPGEYSVKVVLGIDNAPADWVEDASRFTVIEADYYGTGELPGNGLFVLKHQWYLDKNAVN
jgi:lipopolysaccharide transport system ATP-binding protein